MPELSTEFCGVSFKNPLVVASIEPTNSVDNIKKCIDAGAGGAIIKTISELPDWAELTRHSKYAILNDKGQVIRGKIPHHFTFYSRSGYVSEPYREWARYLREAQAYAEINDSHVIGNVSAGTLPMWKELARMCEDCGVPLLELNLQHPHPRELLDGAHGGLIAQDERATREVTASVVDAVDIPVFVKLSPEAMDLTAIARAAREGGAAAVSVCSRFKGFATDIDSGQPHIGAPAGVGGPWIKPVTLRWVHEIYSQLGMEIAGSNGIYDARDAVEFMMSGARLVQVGSILMLKGIDWLTDMVKGLDAFLADHGYPGVEAIHGLSSRQAAASLKELFEANPIQAFVDPEKCRFPKCTNCIRSCFYDAMSVTQETVESSADSCIGCRLCYDVCPFGAISLPEQNPSREIA